MSRKYPKLKDGQAFDINWRKDFLCFCCCDCGLVHGINFTVKNEKLRMRFWRLNRNTGQVRRWRNTKKDK